MHDVGAVRHQTADRDLAALHHIAAQPQSADGGQVHHQLHQRHDGDHQPRRLHRNIAQPVGGIVEFGFFVVFAHKGFDDPNVGDRFLHPTVQVVDALLHFFKQREAFGHDDGHDNGDHRHRKHRYQRQLGADRQRVDQRTGKHGGGKGDHAQRLDKGVLHVGDIVGQPRHQRCGREFVDVGMGIAQHFAIQPFAQRGAEPEGAV